MIQGGGFTPTDGREADAPADPERGDQRPAQHPRHAGDGATERAPQRHVAVLHQRRRQPRPRSHRASRRDDFGYAVFGRVLSGMDVVDRIAAVPTHAPARHGATCRSSQSSIKGVQSSIRCNPEGARSRVAARCSSSSSRSSSTSSASGSSSRCCRSTPRRSARRRWSSGCCSPRSRSASWSRRRCSAISRIEWGRRPVLIFSLLGTVVSFVMLGAGAQPADAVRRAHRRRAVGRQHHHGAGLHRRHHHRREPRASRSACSAPRSASASSSVRRLARCSRTSATPRRSGRPRPSPWSPRCWRGSGCPRPSTARTPAAGSPWHALAELGGRAQLRAAVHGGLRVLDGVRRLPDDVRAVRRAAVRVRRRAHRLSAERVRVPRRARPGRAGRAGGGALRRAAARSPLGLLFAAVGWGGSALTHSLPVFVAMLVPGAIGIGLCNATLSTLISNAAGPHEQGRVQGAAGALESLGRTIGPVWGNGALQAFGEGTAYGSAAIALLGAAAPDDARITSRAHSEARMQRRSHDARIRSELSRTATDPARGFRTRSCLRSAQLQLSISRRAG